MQLSIKDQQRIDVDVGLYWTEKAFFGSHLYEWSLMKGKETKAPELVQFWNSVLANEVEAEKRLVPTTLVFWFGRRHGGRQGCRH